MSACSAQAMSQVGCRLMVASSANTSRPFAPAACGDVARALATKAAMSSEADGLASGTEPALPDAALRPADTSVADFGLVGSPDISARYYSKSYVGRQQAAVNARTVRRSFCRSFLRPIEPAWTRRAKPTVSS